MNNRLSDKALLVTSSILDAFDWMKSAPESVARGKEHKTWRQCAYEDFVDSLNRVYRPIDADAQRGIDFESGMVMDLYNTREFFVKKHGELLAIVYDKGHGAVQQATLKKTVILDDQAYVLYGKADALIPGKHIIDWKTTGKWSGPEKYTGRAQHLQYIVSSGIPSFEYVVVVGSMKEGTWTPDGVIPIDASMSVEEATERLSNRIRSFVAYLEAHPDLLDAYVHVFTK